MSYRSKLSKEEIEKAIKISNSLSIQPSWLFACMGFETGGSYSPSQKNRAGSSATGLIGFMRKTAEALGTTIEKLEKMTVSEQLDYVYKYFKQHTGKMNSLADVYMAIIRPICIGKPLNHVMFKKDDIKYPKNYLQNKGLDFNKDGVITIMEAVKKVEAYLECE